MKYTLEEIEVRFKAAPNEIQNLLRSEAVGQQFTDLAKVFDLNEREFEEYVDESGLVLLGFTPLGQFDTSLAERLKTSIEDARKITEETNRQVFAPARSYMNWWRDQSGTNDGQPQSVPENAAPTMNMPARDEAVARLEEAREDAIEAAGGEQTIHERKLGSIVTSKTSELNLGDNAQSAAATPPEMPKSDPYREPID